MTATAKIIHWIRSDRLGHPARQALIAALTASALAAPVQSPMREPEMVKGFAAKPATDKPVEAPAFKKNSPELAGPTPPLVPIDDWSFGESFPVNRFEPRHKKIDPITKLPVSEFPSVASTVTPDGTSQAINSMPGYPLIGQNYPPAQGPTVNTDQDFIGGYAVAGTVPATVTVNPIVQGGVVPVPEPSAILILTPLLAMLSRRSRRRRQNVLFCD